MNIVESGRKRKLNVLPGKSVAPEEIEDDAEIDVYTSMENLKKTKYDTSYPSENNEIKGKCMEEITEKLSLKSIETEDKDNNDNNKEWKEEFHKNAEQEKYYVSSTTRKRYIEELLAALENEDMSDDGLEDENEDENIFYPNSREILEELTGEDEEAEDEETTSQEVDLHQDSNPLLVEDAS
ncbi:unnamed protein product [Euphydryas editha]|uniref:Uncharacterized protein n=1 Tax=Euphydryas editha TaxID=104508 RepID=A0AAU9UPJ5_EUPED|nr:unnamed protein product [Euphydryas editha]